MTTAMHVATFLAAAAFSISSVACSSEIPEEGTTSSGDELNALPGEYQARLRASTGEDIVLAFDKTTKALDGRPECTVTLAKPLRVAVSKGGGIVATSARVEVDTYLRGKTIAFAKAPELSRQASLVKKSTVSIGAEISELEIARSCSGETLEVHQNLRVTIEGRLLVDPIGNKDNFWTTLGSAPKTGISPSTRTSLALRSAQGADASLTFGKLVGDDPRQPATCTQVTAIPARLVVKAEAAKTVMANITNIMRARTVAPTPAPSSPGALRLDRQPDGTFAIDVPPMVISSQCSGEPTTYAQELTLTVDGRAHSPLAFDMSKSPN